MNKLQQWRENILWPFCEDGWIEGIRGKPMSAQLDWEEQHLFNEARLYSALGKEDARSVLTVWRRFRTLCEEIRAATDYITKHGKDEKDVSLEAAVLALMEYCCKHGRSDDALEQAVYDAARRS